MEQEKVKNKIVIGCISFCIAMLCTWVSIFVLSNIFLKRNQLYTDIVSELSAANQNKSGELYSVWISLFIGIFIFICAFLYFATKAEHFTKYKNAFDIQMIDLEILVPIIILIVMLIFGKRDIRLLIAFVLYVGLKLLSSSLGKDVCWKYKIIFCIYLLYMDYYAFLSILYSLNADKYPLLISALGVCFFMVGINVLAKRQMKNRRYLCNIAVLQIPIPFLLLNLCMHQYNYNSEKIIRINLGIPYYALIFTLIFGLLLVNVTGAKKVYANRKHNDIFLGTVISLSIFYLNYDVSLLNSGDLWHPGEQLLPWHQIIEKGLGAYVEYDPASGLYPLITGFFNEVFLGGHALTYNISESLFRILFVILLICAVYQIDKKTALLIAVFIPLTYYTRPLIFIPAYFILSNEKLVKKRIYWILMWILTSFMAGLYYPLNGVAVMLGSFPFAVVQLNVLMRQKEYKLYKKDTKLYAFALLEVSVIILSLKTLFYMFLHITSLSEQSVTADGILAFHTANPPEWFWAFIGKEAIRRQAYAIFTFWMPIAVCSLFILLLFLYLFTKNWKKRIETRTFFMLSFPIIVLMISYTYTFIRIDPSTMFARSAPVMVVTLTFLIVLMMEFQKAGGSKYISGIFVGIAFGIIFLIQDCNIGNEKNLVKREMYIGDGYQYVNGEEINLPRLGEGFIDKYTYDRIINLKTNLNQLLGEGENFLDMTFSQELYYIFDVEVPVNDPGTYVVSSYTASKENLQDIRTNMPPVVIWGDTWYGRSAVRNYYMFRELMELGYVLYENNYCEFLVSRNKFMQLWGEDAYKLALEDMVANSYTDKFSPVNLQGTPAAWGNSFSTLENRFAEVSNIDVLNSWTYMMHYEKAKWMVDDGIDPLIVFNLGGIEGRNADFLFLDLDVQTENKDNIEVTIFWETDKKDISESRCYQFKLDKGKLLIPIGIHPGWSQENISALRIDFDGLNTGDTVAINYAKLLKLEVAD